MADKPTTPEENKYDLTADDVLDIMKAAAIEMESEEDAIFLDENKHLALDFIENIILPLYQNEVKKAETAGEETTISILYERTRKQLTKHLDAWEQAKEEYTKEKAKSHAENMFSNPFLPMYHDEPSDELIGISKKDFEIDEYTKKAYFITKKGHTITVEHYDDLLSILSTSAKKILNVSLAALANNNYYGTNNADPIVEIPLKEYGEANGVNLTPQTMSTPEEQAAENRRVNDRKKNLKENIRRDLHDLSDILFTGEITKGKNRGDYNEMRLISSHGVSGGYIHINFDVNAANFFSKSYIMQLPTALLKHDNRKTIPYIIGYKIAIHHSIDQNHAAGTENTLSVAKLLEAAKEAIPTYEELQARNQRNWKDKIKKPLENGLNENVKIKYLQRWEYRDPKTGERYTPETAQPLRWDKYKRLMVDFVVIDPPDQKERREAKAEAKRKAAEEKGLPQKKRGRPKKQPEK